MARTDGVRDGWATKWYFHAPAMIALPTPLPSSALNVTMFLRK
jgi:hypothetical protein